MSSSRKKLRKFRIPLKEIIKATQKFSSENLIGNGGFGTVYRGQLSEKWENRLVAFKCLDPKSYQGREEFYNEVTIVSSFNHPNIISFIGYCHKANKMIIVYDYASSGSLDSHLARHDRRDTLTWAHRLEICLGAATGLMHLHSHSQNGKIVIHRDVKSANILLDEHRKAKICDFGLSRFGQKDAQLITRRAGTDFYMDPSFNESRKISGETDVYSFGVVLFEMLRGTLVYSELLVEDDKKEYLIDFVRRVYDDHPKKLIDPSLSADIDEKSFNIFKAIAYECINREPEKRPPMSKVTEQLQSAVFELKDKKSPAVTTEAVVKFLHIHTLYPELRPYEHQIESRMNTFFKQKMLIEKYECPLEEFAQGYLKFGFNRDKGVIVYREWAPAAAEACLFGEFNGWERSNHKMKREMFGVWTIKIDDEVNGKSAICHDRKVKFTFKHHQNGDWIDRVPAWINFTRSDAPLALDGVYREPWESKRNELKKDRSSKEAPKIYTVHFGMCSGSEPRVKSYREFADNILPRVKDNNYNTILLMGVMEHSHYGSFGYYVTNFFAVSSVSGKPEDLKYLIDKAHGFHLRVLMDVVHSHVSSNKEYGLYGFHVGQATQDSYFKNSCHDDRRFFNYSNWEVLRFLLSNLRWWLMKFEFDGFRFNGITSMLYRHHGTKFAFTGNYNEYFGDSINVDAIVYMMLANFLIHKLLPSAIVIADDVSGMPGLCLAIEEGGLGFDYS